jgi:biopolymer transport protein ExbB
MSGFFNALHNAAPAVKLIISLVIPAAFAIGLGIAMTKAKKMGVLSILLYVCGLIITFIIFQTLPDFVRASGPLVAVLIFIFILLVTYLIERYLTLNRAQGKAPVNEFMRTYMKDLSDKNFDKAMTDCDAQGGTMATVLRGGLEQVVTGSGPNVKITRSPSDIRRTFEEATSRETPLLERNLIALTTIASIATMIGLLGTTIGMIRAFQAMAHTGAPDAIQLARGISEALFNTAGGLANAILGIVGYNFFVNRVDRFSYEINEAVYDTLDVLERC